MKKMKPLLISDGADRARLELDEHRNRARLMTELVRAYNRLPHLSDIDTAVEAREFLSDPIDYLNTCIDNQLATGIVIGKIRPDASRVAELYGIPYAPMLQRINMMRPHLRNFDRFGFDESARTVVLLPEGEEAIRELCKVYLTNEQEIELYQTINDACDMLNTLCDKFSIPAHDRNPAAVHLNFMQCMVNGRAWHFVPNVERLRACLAQESFKKQ
jgi:hypothetical protein